MTDSYRRCSKMGSEVSWQDGYITGSVIEDRGWQWKGAFLSGVL